MRFTLILLFILAGFPAQALEITGLSIERDGGGEHVSLGLTSEIKPRVFSLDNPPRVVVDVPIARWNGKVGLPANYKGTLVQKVRFGFHDARTNRIVFDLAGNPALKNIQFTRSRKGYWLEFDLMGHAPGRHSSDSSPETPQAKHGFWYRPPATSESADTEIAEKQESQQSQEKSGKPVIVIDAGHGGQDPGTAGHGGAKEKQITLRYAYQLRDALLKTGRYRVALTRDGDYYLFLRDRVKRARAAKGDLFISLHADSAPTRSMRGLSVYTISEKASDKEAELLAAQENKADVIGGMDLSDASPDVADILIDLAQRETRAKSAKFADLAMKNLGREVHLLSNTHRFAGFAVLKAPDIPSVLIEIGFLTTPHEERLLESTGYQAKVVRGLTKAIDSYFGKHKK